MRQDRYQNCDEVLQDLARIEKAEFEKVTPRVVSRKHIVRLPHRPIVVAVAAVAMTLLVCLGLLVSHRPAADAPHPAMSSHRLHELTMAHAKDPEWLKRLIEIDDKDGALSDTQRLDLYYALLSVLIEQGASSEEITSNIDRLYFTRQRVQHAPTDCRIYTDTSFAWLIWDVSGDREHSAKIAGLALRHFQEDEADALLCMSANHLDAGNFDITERQASEAMPDPPRCQHAAMKPALLGAACMYRRKFKEAKQAYLEAPGGSSPLDMARACYALRDYKSALSLAEQGVQSHSKDLSAAAMRYKVMALYELGRKQEALDLYTRVPGENAYKYEPKRVYLPAMRHFDSWCYLQFCRARGIK